MLTFRCGNGYYVVGITALFIFQILYSHTESDYILKLYDVPKHWNWGHFARFSSFIGKRTKCKWLPDVEMVIYYGVPILLYLYFKSYDYILKLYDVPIQNVCCTHISVRVDRKFNLITLSWLSRKSPVG